jgi:hypothetical protein
MRDGTGKGPNAGEFAHCPRVRKAGVGKRRWAGDGNVEVGLDTD